MASSLGRLSTTLASAKGLSRRFERAPVFPDKPTFSDTVGMSQRCHETFDPYKVGTISACALTRYANSVSTSWVFATSWSRTYETPRVYLFGWRHGDLAARGARAAVCEVGDRLPKYLPTRPAYPVCGC